MSVGWLDLVKFLDKLAGTEHADVLRSETLDGNVNALSVGSIKKLCQFSGPIHGLLLDLNRLTNPPTTKIPSSR